MQHLLLNSPGFLDDIGESVNFYALILCIYLKKQAESLLKSAKRCDIV